MCVCVCVYVCEHVYGCVDAGMRDCGIMCACLCVPGHMGGSTFACLCVWDHVCVFECVGRMCVFV